jgi:hypothetical protein
MAAWGALGWWRSILGCEGMQENIPLWGFGWLGWGMVATRTAVTRGEVRPRRAWAGGSAVMKVVVARTAFCAEADETQRAQRRQLFCRGASDLPRAERVSRFGRGLGSTVARHIHAGCRMIGAKTVSEGTPGWPSR